MSKTQEIITSKDTFKVIDKYFEQKNILYSHQINSFDQFIGETIPNFLERQPHVFYEQVTKDKIYKYSFIFSEVRIKPPFNEGEEEPLFPYDARLLSTTYAGKLVSKVEQIQETIDIATGESVKKTVGSIETDVPIARIPIMLRTKYCNLTLVKEHVKASKECDYDPGAYFIVNGSEKVVMALEKMIDNKPLVFIKKEQKDVIHICQVNSKNYMNNSNMQIFTIRMKKENSIDLLISQFKEISIFTMLRALGLDRDRDIVDYIVNDPTDLKMINYVQLCIETSKIKKGKKGSEGPKTGLSQEDSINALIDKMQTRKTYSDVSPEINLQQKKMHLNKILTNDILPHIGTNLKQKAYFICYMINKLVKCKLKRSVPDDRDSFINKRIELQGPLLFSLFQQSFKRLINECHKQFDTRGKDPEFPANIINQIKPNIIEQNIRSSLSTGSWGGSKTRKGVAQMKGNLSYNQAISALRKVNSPNIDASTNKLTGPRQLHNSQHEKICPVEVPEGAKTGLTKSLAMLASITLMMETQIGIIKEKLVNMIDILEDVSPYHFKSKVKVFLNGEWLGMAKDPIKMLTVLREYRFTGVIEKTVSIAFWTKEKEIRIACDGGRAFNPLLTVFDNKLTLTKDIIKDIPKMKTWNEFMSKYPKVVEYIDIEEGFTTLVAAYPEDVSVQYNTIQNNDGSVTASKIDTSRINRYDNGVYLKFTHCEFHPSLNLGTIASSIPFANHNQSPRNIFQYSQTKQGMGIVSFAYQERLDITYILYHGQLPIVASVTIKYTHLDKMHSGENIIVCVNSYSGYNQEDSVILNQGAISRGLFYAKGLKKNKDEIKPNQPTSQHDVFMKPSKDKVSGMGGGNYEKLNSLGYAPEETLLEDGDAIIGKGTPIEANTVTGKKYKDASSFYKSNISGRIDKVYTGLKTQDGYDMVQMRIRSLRIPMPGDKFSCYSEDTEVLTDKGFIFWKSLTKKHRVATLVDGKTLLYEKPKEIFKYKFEGEMLLFQNDSIDFCVTPNHNMYVQCDEETEYSLQRADSIVSKKCTFKKTVQNISEDIETFKISEDFTIKMDDWLFLFASYTHVGASLKDKHTHFSIDMVDIIQFKKMCDSYGITYYCDYEKIEVHCIINDSRIYEHLYEFDGGDGLPEWVWTLSQRQANILLNTTEEIKTDYEFMANDIQRLMIHCGKSCNINNLKNQENKNVENYDGIVYCCEVTSNVIMVRRNGKAAWSGNSRAGQKGTTGIILEHEDMPFTSNGMVPDMIINPNCLPKRMTLGQMIETLCGKVGVLTGTHIDATPFNGTDIDSVKDALEKLGFERNGTEKMYNGMTGEAIETEIFIGPTFYQRLKHLVADKIHSRATGSKQILVRQPPEGRTKSGGLRFGEMERDCMISHGTSAFLRERLLDSSDLYSCYICDRCGFIATKMKNKNVHYCKACENTTEISKIILPYAFKLFVQELMAMNIAMRIKTKKDIHKTTLTPTVIQK